MTEEERQGHISRIMSKAENICVDCSRDIEESKVRFCRTNNYGPPKRCVMCAREATAKFNNRNKIP